VLATEVAKTTARLRLRESDLASIGEQLVRIDSPQDPESDIAKGAVRACEAVRKAERELAKAIFHYDTAARHAASAIRQATERWRFFRRFAR
jgi:hypothetical protein